jgi:hypothetical protein
MGRKRPDNGRYEVGNLTLDGRVGSGVHPSIQASTAHPGANPSPLSPYPPSPLALALTPTAETFPHVIYVANLTPNQPRGLFASSCSFLRMSPLIPIPAPGQPLTWGIPRCRRLPWGYGSVGPQQADHLFPIWCLVTPLDHVDSC